MVYDNICRFAEKRNISITDLEKKASIGNGTIGKWKNGVSPSLDKLKAVADVLNVKVATLLKE